MRNTPRWNRNRGVPHPRPSRRGLKIYKWPDEHLAVVYAAYCVFHELTNNELFRIVVNNRLDIASDYLTGRGQALAPNQLAQRIDKAHRQCELKNYRHLLPAAIDQVRKWRYDI